MDTNYKEYVKRMNETFKQKEDDLSPLMEGIDIDIKNKIVSFTNKHENNVDTPDIINPTYSNIDGHDVISIFKRIGGNVAVSDGNPLIYALKGINGWTFKNCKKDIDGLLKQFIKISGKIQNHYDTIVTIPSSNRLNTEFLHHLNKILKCDKTIENFFDKLEAGEVNICGIDNDAINKDKNSKIIWIDIQKSIQAMVDNNNNIFSYKYLKPQYRKYFIKTITYDVYH